MQEKSSFLRLNWLDLGKSAVVAFLTVFVGALIATVTEGAFPTGEQLLLAAKAGGLAAVGYLLKNFLSGVKEEDKTPPPTV